MSTQASTNESSLQPYGFNIEQWRRRVPACERLVLMNNCSQTPQTDHTRMAAERYLESWSREVMDWDRWEDEVDALKADFAAFINASPDEIATLTSVSEATAVLISALPLKDRKKVVLTEAEFPCVAHIILAHGRYGLEPAWVPIRDEIIHAEDYDPLIDESTLLVSATHAFYQNGYVQDIAAIAKKAHDKGAFLFVDAYQSSGIVPIDVKAMDVDFLTTGTLKWMFGVPGIAFLYAKKELLRSWSLLIRVGLGAPMSSPSIPNCSIGTQPPSGSRPAPGRYPPSTLPAAACRSSRKWVWKTSATTHARSRRASSTGPGPGPHAVRNRRCHPQDPYHIVHVPGRFPRGTGPDAQTRRHRPRARPRDSTGPPLLQPTGRVRLRGGRARAGI